MSQSFIDALMHFIALLYFPFYDRKEIQSLTDLEDYIIKAGVLFPVADCLKVFNSYYSKYCRDFSGKDVVEDNPENKLQRQLLIDAARRAQMNLYLRERYLLFLALLEYTSLHVNYFSGFTSDIKEIALALNISADEFNEGLKFINEGSHEPGVNELIIEDSNEEILEGSWIEQHKPVIDPAQRYIIDNRIKGQLVIKYFEKYHLFALKYNGAQVLFLNNKEVFPGYFYSFGINAALQLNKNDFIYFDDIATHFNLKYNQARIRIKGESITFRYPYSGYTIKPFNFAEDAGQMIGIVGNNGVGKSTILKLIAGINKPNTGDIFINDASLSQNNFKLQSAIGYVTQDNMYYNELTVYENLYYHARLCMGDLTSAELKKKTEEIIRKFDLQDVQHIRPADFGAEHVSDFDRISLNIAFELIRDPYILCLDEPLTILPFADSKRLLHILKEETFEGKIVFISVHLPSPEIFNLFDKVWIIDQGGHMIYQGGTRQSLDYFHSSGILPFRIVSVREDMVSPEDIISLVETKKVRPDGVISDDRMIEPETWYSLFRKKQEYSNGIHDSGKPLPVKPSSIPGIEMQFFVYLIRLLKIRFFNLKYILPVFTGIPLVGAAIAWITRYSDGVGYTLAGNKLFPLFLFLSLIIIFFAGMLNGADEILPEKSRLKRDLNLKLSHFSYANAKVVFIMLVSAIQTLLFIMVCGFILKIEGLTLPFFLVYFSISVLAGLISLILSAAFRHINAVLIFIPFLVLPNLLFSGYLIPFNDPADLRQNSPVGADLVPVRWGYEALMFISFSENKFNKDLFDDQLVYYQRSYLKENILPVLFTGLEECNKYYHSAENQIKMDSCLRIFRNELYFIEEIEEVAPFASFNYLYPETFNEPVYNELFGYLTYLDFYFESELADLRDRVIYPDAVTAEDTTLFFLRKEHHNQAIQDIVFDSDKGTQVFIVKDHLIKRGKPVYLMPENHFGRAHFFAPYKRVGGQSVSTGKFNINAIWTMNAIFYFIFITGFAVWFLNLFRKRKEIY